MSASGEAEPRRARSRIGRELRITGLGAVIGLAALFALFPAVGSYGAHGVPGGTGEDADIVSMNPKVFSSR